MEELVKTSRQKNCHGCVQTKRRCDRRTPACSRCAEKSIPCLYSKTRVASRSDKSRPAVEPASYTEASLYGGEASSIFGHSLPLDLGCFSSLSPEAYIGPAAESAAQLGAGLPGNDGGFTGNPSGLVDHGASPSPDERLVPTDGSVIIESPRTPAAAQVMRAFEKMNFLCDTLNPWHLYDPNTSLYYLISRIRGFTADMATRNATPFMHRRLYRDHTPQVILSCFAICLLYQNRTAENTAMVMRAIHESVRELIDAEAARIAATPGERLARTQALFLYQIIRLFDGDVTLRAEGEKDSPVLLAWLNELCEIRDNMSDLEGLGENAASKQQPREWQRWIFAESVRRTVVMGYTIISGYELLKAPNGGASQPGAWAYPHRWTLARSLWEASSSSEFGRLWRQKPQFIISNHSLKEFLEHGRGDDVDEFAKFMLAAYMGIDPTKAFISGRSTPAKPA